MHMKPNSISADWTVRRLLDQYPQLALLFVRRGMTCPGCAFSRFDTLREVAGVYGLALPAWLTDLRAEAALPSKIPH